MDKAKFPLSEEIFIKCTIEDPTTHVKVSHKKPFKLTIESPQLSSTDREAAYDDLNSGNAINNIIENYYTDQDRKKKEDDLIFKILSVLPDQKAVEEVKNNSERKKLFLEQVRNGITGYSVDLAKLKRSFKTKLCDEKRKVPAQYLQSQKTFKDYLRADLHGYYEEIATSTIKAHLETKKDDIIKSFLDFQNQTIEHLKDSGYNSNFMEFLGENKKNLTPHERTTRWSRRF
ncbi:hypothetical protein IJM86_05435 [bacterium]|nr:hypothetical protein [bacterium]